jgi:lysyl-tRNA synthetase class 1
MFEAIYLVLVGKRKGPKAASFILSLDADYVRKRFI